MLITFEGGECGGKGIQIKLLKNKLEHSGYKVNAEHWAPGSTFVSEIIRILTKNKHNSEFKFPEEFIYAFDLEKYKNYFEQETIPDVAIKHLEKTKSLLKTGLKYETIHFILKKEFLPEGKLNQTIKLFNEDFNKGKLTIGTPAEYLFKEYSKEKLSPEEQLYLFMAARNILYHNHINKLLKEYDVVIIDRSIDSSTIYQGYVQKPSLIETIRTMSIEATEGTTPDITILMDLPIEEIAKRKLTRINSKKDTGIAKDFFDEQEESFHKKVREGYLKEAEHFSNLPKNDPQKDRIKIINALGTPEEVHERIWKEVSEKLKENKIKNKK